MTQAPSIKSIYELIRNVLVNKWGAFIELAVIVGAAWLVARPLLNFDPALRPPGNEYQAHVGVIIPFLEALKNGTEFPQWNPTAAIGRSLLADPFVFVFNPFLSLPMLLWGVVNGTKIALAFNFVIAGLGMWTVGRLLSFQGITRLWCSLLYMLSGGLVSHLPVGQIQLTFALGWLPWSIASILLVARSRTYLALVLVGLIQAMFYFAGNLYYQMYGLACILVIVVIYSIKWSATPRVDVAVGLRYVAAGLLSVGLIALQLFPQLASQDSIHNSGGFGPNDTEFGGSQTPVNALLNYVVSDRDYYFDPVLGKAPYIQESYRYIGLSPFIFALFLAPAFLHGRRKEIIAFALCFLFMLAWTDMNHSFVQDLYRAVPVLFQFRWPGRALGVGGFFLILLGGFGLAELFALLRASQSTLSIFSAQNQQHFTIRLGALLGFGVVVGVGLAVNNVYLTNRDMVYLETLTSPDWDNALRWLRENDPGPYAVSTAPTITSAGSITGYGLGLRFLNILDGWHPARVPQRIGQQDAVSLAPNYFVIFSADKLSEPNAELMQTFGTVQVWRNANSFPYAFYLPIGKASTQAVITPADVASAALARRDGPNRILVEMESDEQSLLVVSEAWFSGWRVWVDEQPTDLTTVSTALNLYLGYGESPVLLTFPASMMAVQLPPGHHTVLFQFVSPGFTFGLIVSVVTLFVSAGLIWLDLRRVKLSKAPISEPDNLAAPSEANLADAGLQREGVSRKQEPESGQGGAEE